MAEPDPIHVREALPDWATFFTLDELHQFETMVVEELTARSIEFTLEEGAVELTIDDSNVRMGLSNLAQKCHAADDWNDWRAFIGAHVNQLFAPSIVDELAGYDRPRELVKVRLMERSDLSDEHLASMVWRDGPPGTVAVIALDFPDRIALTGREQLAPLDLSDGDLFQLGLQNVRDEEPPEEFSVEVGRDADAGIDGASIEALNGDSFFTATRVLWAEEFLDIEPHNGALISIPNRHIVFGYAIHDDDAAGVVVALNELIGMTRHWYVEGPGSISRDVYWYREGQFIPFELVETNNAMVLNLSDDFTELMNRLAGGDDDTADGSDT